jgi:predicted nucleotidyltransferase
MKTTQSIPNIRTSERNDLIRQITAHLQQDERVRAAWLSGSIARGEDDWLSDIDLHVAVVDDSIEEVVRDRHEFAAGLMPPTLSMDHMRNAPPRGGYLLVHYSGEYGPQHVDWFWQPESLAHLPDNGQLLFDKAGLPVIDGKVWEDEMNQSGSRPAIDSTDPIDLATHNLQFFWAMGLIVAKYIVRGDDETVGHMLGLIERTLDGIVEALGISEIPSTEPEISDIGRMGQFLALRVASSRAKLLHVVFGGLGVEVPTEAIAEVERFFDACESVMAV